MNPDTNSKPRTPLRQLLTGNGEVHYNLVEMVIFTIVAIGLWVRSDLYTTWGIPGQTTALVVYLGALLAVFNIGLPTRWHLPSFMRVGFLKKLHGTPLPLWAYPPMAAGLSCLMDSFLVLLMIAAATIVAASKMGESELDRQTKIFYVYCTAGALIGGLGTYFGEVYELPVALQYGQHSWNSMFPILPPVIIFSGVLGVLASRLNIQVQGPGADGELTIDEAQHAKASAGTHEYIVFLAAVIALLVLHNGMQCLSLLVGYLVITGKTHWGLKETAKDLEWEVMGILIAAIFLGQMAAPYMENFQGYWVMIPAGINAVVVGAIFPASGDFWFDTVNLSTTTMWTPLASLVAIVLFKTGRDWKIFMVRAVPLSALWFVLASSWFSFGWPLFDDDYYAMTGWDRPELRHGVDHSALAHIAEPEAVDHTTTNGDASKELGCQHCLPCDEMALGPYPQDNMPNNGGMVDHDGADDTEAPN